MPLPPIPFSNEVQKQAYEDLAKGSMRQFGDALALIVGKVLSPTYKSPEERALDWQTGAEESENRRRLAAEALDRVPPERRIFPAPQIAGPILRDIEFELPETPIWEMWSQLLSRACDSERTAAVHPAFLVIIRQLSADEALLLSSIRGRELLVEFDATPSYEEAFTREEGFTLLSDVPSLSQPDAFAFYFEHLEALGLVWHGDQQHPEANGFAPTFRMVRRVRLSALGEQLLLATRDDGVAG